MTAVPVPPELDLGLPPADVPVADACELAWLLLDGNRDLGSRIRMFTLWTSNPRVTIQLAPTRESLTDLAGWAGRCGGVLLAETHVRADGSAYRSCAVTFELLGHRVEIFAHLPVENGRSAR